MVRFTYHFFVLVIAGMLITQCGREEKTRVVYKNPDENKNDEPAASEPVNTPEAKNKPKKDPVSPVTPPKPVNATNNQPQKNVRAEDETKKKSKSEKVEDSSPKWQLKGVEWKATIHKTEKNFVKVTIMEGDEALVSDYRLDNTTKEENPKFFSNPKATKYNAYYKRETYSTVRRGSREIFFIRHTDTQECELRVLITGWFVAQSDIILQGKCPQ